MQENKIALDNYQNKRYFDKKIKCIIYDYNDGDNNIIEDDFNNRLAYFFDEQINKQEEQKEQEKHFKFYVYNTNYWNLFKNYKNATISDTLRCYVNKEEIQKVINKMLVFFEKEIIKEWSEARFKNYIEKDLEELDEEISTDRERKELFLEEIDNWNYNSFIQWFSQLKKILTTDNEIRNKIIKEITYYWWEYNYVEDEWEFSEIEELDYLNLLYNLYSDYFKKDIPVLYSDYLNEELNINKKINDLIEKELKEKNNYFFFSVTMKWYNEYDKYYFAIENNKDDIEANYDNTDNNKKVKDNISILLEKTNFNTIEEWWNKVKKILSSYFNVIEIIPYLIYEIQFYDTNKNPTKKTYVKEMLPGIVYYDDEDGTLDQIIFQSFNWYNMDWEVLDLNEISIFNAEDSDDIKKNWKIEKYSNISSIEYIENMIKE